MEGPSLVIATEEFDFFNGMKVTAFETALKLPNLKGQKFLSAKSWGKHLILQFEKSTLRIHFLMFGSYRINDPRPNRVPKLKLRFAGDEIFFYSCSIKEIPKDLNQIYDWSIDVMSSSWNVEGAAKKLLSRPQEMVCDVLMNQDIFAGVGNIIKNEVLYRMRMHPETLLGGLSPQRIRVLCRETENYCLQFYEWKLINQLKKNWLIFRKKECPQGHGKVIKAPTGKLARISHYCPICQEKS